MTAGSGGSQTGPVRGWSLPRVVVGAWLAFALALGVKTLLQPRAHTVYPNFECGSLCWWRDVDMYDPRNCPQLFQYSPAFAVALTPLALLPTALGGLLWSWLNLAALYHGARAFATRVLPGVTTERSLAIFLFLVLAKSARGAWAAQSNDLLLASVLGAAVAILAHHWWTASLLLALATHVKVWPLAAGLLLAACWPRQLSWRLLVAVLAVGAVPFLTRPPEIVWQHYVTWYHTLVGPLQARHDFRDFWTLWEALSPPVSPRGYVAWQLCAALVAVILCLSLRWRGRGPREALTFTVGIWLVWQLVFGPGTERNTFGLLGPLLAWALIISFTTRHGRVWLTLAAVLTTVCSTGQFERWLGPTWPIVRAAHPLGTLLYGAWLIAYCCGPQAILPTRPTTGLDLDDAAPAVT